MESKFKINPDAPKNESGLTQMITMGKSIHHEWVKHGYVKHQLKQTNSGPKVIKLFHVKYPNSPNILNIEIEGLKLQS